MMFIGIDPGPLSCGWVLYDGERVWDCGDAPLDEMMALILDHPVDVVAIERVQAQGKAGNQITETCEISARLYQYALDTGHRAHWLYRRVVLRVLDVTGEGNRDALVRARLLEMHGGLASKGTRKAPGPLYGVSGHAWQALAVAVTAMRVEEETEKAVRNGTAGG